jgi:adenosylcobinamide kinase / adenosylcobinamide-phosphate guanylyltransferase
MLFLRLGAEMLDWNATAEPTGEGGVEEPHKISHRQVFVITGPARSGKSEWAETLAHQLSARSPVVYIATAQIDPTDAEWQARIQQHQRRRPADWPVLPVPIALAATIQEAAPHSCLLIDSLGTWLANLLDQDDTTWADTVADFLASVQTSTSTLIFVSEETGWGVVPAYPLGRLFRDRLGHLTRQLAPLADAVYLVTGGYVLNLSQLGQPLATALSLHPTAPQPKI